MAKGPLPKFPKYKKEVISGGLILSVMLPCPGLLKGSFLKEPSVLFAPKRVFPGSVAWASYDDIGLVKNETSLCVSYKQPLTTCFGVVARQSCLSGVSPGSYGSQIVFCKNHLFRIMAPGQVHLQMFLHCRDHDKFGGGGRLVVLI